ncbi:MAG: peptidoglycan bridge formation glycyltransferase FemA/FemB family protein [bacterium]|nr:peptidoglycan bridge formation glycyltransferase FemA/FemB family protein [bacterium]
MELRKIEEKKLWEDFVVVHAPRSGAFLHAWDYGELELDSKKNVERVGFFDDEVLVGVALLSVTRLPFGMKYASILRGPITKKGVSLEEVLKIIGDYLMDVTFIRFEPTGKKPEWARETIHVSPEDTLILDLGMSEQKLLEAMHSKTRYNIRLSEKKGVTIQDLKKDEFEDAWKIFRMTAERDEFRLHGRLRYEMWFENVSNARLVGAFLNGKLLAVNLMMDHAGTRTYVHGASSNENRNVMAPFALQWHEIVDAKKNGLKHYDFWGVSDTNPKWKGITRFKKGFGGERVTYPGTYDYVLKKSWYLLYRALRAIRRN